MRGELFFSRTGAHTVAPGRSAWVECGIVLGEERESEPTEDRKDRKLMGKEDRNTERRCPDEADIHADGAYEYRRMPIGKREKVTRTRK